MSDPKKKASTRPSSVDADRAPRRRRNKTLDASIEGIMIFARALVETGRSKEFIDACRGQGIRVRIPWALIDLAGDFLGEEDNAASEATTDASFTASASPGGRFLAAAKRKRKINDDKCES